MCPKNCLPQRDCAALLVQVITVPPNKPCIREDHPRRLFASDEPARREMDAIVRTATVSGRPLLIGTASTSASERIYKSVRAALREQERGLMKLAAAYSVSGAPSDPMVHS